MGKSKRRVKVKARAMPVPHDVVADYWLGPVPRVGVVVRHGLTPFTMRQRVGLVILRALRLAVTPWPHGWGVRKAEVRTVYTPTGYAWRGARPVLRALHYRRGLPPSKGAAYESRKFNEWLKSLDW